jgi:hypothetical protein
VSKGVLRSRKEGKAVKAATMSRGAKASRTQWAAQFLVAAELVRNGYVVSFTMGNNMPIADLMVGKPDGTSLFWVDVKGLASKGPFLVKKKPTHERLFYVLVRVGEKRPDDDFFVLSQEQINHLIDESKRLHPGPEGFRWVACQPFHDEWNVLPGWPTCRLQSAE